MYCPQCGEANDDALGYCRTCGLDLEQSRRDLENSKNEPRSEPAQTPAGERRGMAEDQWRWERPDVRPQPPNRYPPPPYTNPYGHQPTYAYGLREHVPSYMAWAIITLILCFWPTGIVAVVYASKVDNRLAIGDVAGAREASGKAKMWSWISFIIAIAGLVIAIGLAILFFVMGATIEYYG